MNLLNRFMTLLVLGAALLILPQCADKTSSDYVRDGLKYIDQQDYDRAETAFKRAIDANPGNPEAYYGLGGIYNMKERYPEAEEAFHKTLRLDPTHHDAHYSLGYTYEQMGRKEEAEKEFAHYKRLKKIKGKALEEDLKTH